MNRQFHRQIIFIVFSFPFLAFGQNDTIQEKKLRNEISTDITKAITTVFNSSFFKSNSYALFYKRYFKKSALRLAVGGNFYNNQNTDSRDTLVNIQKTNNYAINSNAGYEWHYPLDVKWSLVYGVDIIFSYSSSNSRNEINYSYPYSSTRSEIYNQINLGPFGGIKFKINRRFALSTEVAIIAGYYERKTKIIYDNPPSSNTNSVTNGTQTTVNKTILLHLYF